MGRVLATLLLLTAAAWVTYAAQQWGEHAMLAQAFEGTPLSRGGTGALGALPNVPTPMVVTWHYLLQAVNSVLVAAVLYGLAIWLGINRSLSFWNVASFAAQLSLISPGVSALGRAAQVAFGARPTGLSHAIVGVPHVVTNVFLTIGVILAAVWCFVMVPRMRTPEQSSMVGSVAVVTIAALVS
jgi:hypothetical protein